MEKSAPELDEIRLNLPRHTQNWGITSVCGRQRGRGIEQPGTRHDHAYADLVGRACVAVGHVRRGLLVARVNDANRALLRVEGVKCAIELDAGERKNGLDTVGDE